MVLGRFLFGLGGETLLVVQSVFISKWFLDGGLMQFATGICIGMPFIFDFFSGFVFNKAYETFGLGFAQQIGLLVCVVSCVSAFKLNRLQTITEQHDSRILEESASERDTSHDFSFRGLADLSRLFWLTCFASLFAQGISFTSIVIGSDMLAHRFNFSETEAGSFNSLPYLLTALSMPAIGQIVDGMGNRMYFILGMCLIAILAHT